jgi:L-lactate dehydrogenase (cytochrome)
MASVLLDELVIFMRLLGITELAQLHPGLVNTLQIDNAIPWTVGHPYVR